MNWSRHGQRERSTLGGTYGTANQGETLEDDHHSPVNPAEYLELRVTPLLSFYQRRLPWYERKRTCTEVFSIIAGLAGTMLAAISFETWAPILVAVSAALTAWHEFQSTRGKLTRYSDVLHGISRVTLWWDALTDVDKASQSHIDTLISSCEDLFATEYQAWLNTSLESKVLSKQADRGTEHPEMLV